VYVLYCTAEMIYDDSLKRYINFKGAIVAYFKAWFRDWGKLSVVYKKFDYPRVNYYVCHV
jgi:hypothetical protein